MTPQTSQTPSQIKLSPKETEIAELVLRGRSNSQIASSLFVHTQTIKYHIGNIFRKTKTSSRTDFIVAAFVNPQKFGIEDMINQIKQDLKDA